MLANALHKATDNTYTWLDTGLLVETWFPFG